MRRMTVLLAFCATTMLASAGFLARLTIAEEPRTFPLTVSGKALDADSKPLEGATIFLVASSGIAKLLGHAKTGPDGCYKFDKLPLPVPKRPNKEYYEEATFQIFGTAPGRAFAWRGAKAIYLDERFRNERVAKQADFFERGFLPDETIELDLTFVTGRTISGRFVDEAGQPIEGVKVALHNCDYVDTTGKESHVNYREFRLGSHSY